MEVVIDLPSPVSTIDVTLPDGAVTQVRRHGNPAGPRVLLSHGNGFAIDAYYPYWSRLSAEFEVLVYDQRNHGRNPYCGSVGHHIDGFADDLERVLDAVDASLGAKPAYGAFHSISAIAALTHAQRGRWRWAGLALFDPPIVPARDEPLHERARAAELFLARWAIERPDRFEAPEAHARALAERPMQGCVAGAANLMARCQLVEAPDGWRLACRRELEASIYIANAFSSTWSGLGRLGPHRERILVLSSDPTLERPRYPGLVGQRLAEIGFQVRPVAGTSHLLQLEDPETCARETRSFFLGLERRAAARIGRPAPPSGLGPTT